MVLVVQAFLSWIVAAKSSLHSSDQRKGIAYVNKARTALEYQRCYHYVDFLRWGGTLQVHSSETNAVLVHVVVRATAVAVLASHSPIARPRTNYQYSPVLCTRHPSRKVQTWAVDVLS